MYRHRICLLVVALSVSCLGPAARAGLHYSGEEIAPLPSQWRGFLIDQRLLRTVGFKPAPGTRVHPMRVRYEKALASLEKLASKRALTAGEQADLGAIHLRLGNVAKALEVLRAAQRQHPKHYRIVSNLGTAWQMNGDPGQAEVYLKQAVKLAPGSLQRAEEYQLALVRQASKQDRDPKEPYPLLPVHFVNEKGAYEPGKLASAQRKLLPAHAVADLQRLALWLPADGRLLWLLAELAAVQGDTGVAASIMDGLVTEFALPSRELRRRRRLMREEADAQAKALPTKAGHQGHVGALKARSSRPLVDQQGLVGLPPVRADGLNVLPWGVVTRTTLDRQFRPTFPAYLRELDGKQVRLAGYFQSLTMDAEQGSFLLIEYPVGCWFCEKPDVTAMVLIQMPTGKAQAFTRDAIEVTGQLHLNSTNPEDFLYRITDVKVTR